MRKPRAICSTCRAEVVLRKDGTYVEHRDRRHAMHGVAGAVREGKVPVCPASGQKPMRAAS